TAGAETHDHQRGEQNSGQFLCDFHFFLLLFLVFTVCISIPSGKTIKQIIQVSQLSIKSYGQEIIIF
ncbi:MAG: hypothetical protein IKT01_00790, partial [Eubacteriaceae bacterium]|nr:hypothetical protein [Eubacteriaceae bacterium]